MISRRASLLMLIVLAAAITAVACMMPRVPQPMSYHQFADQRSLFGITNFGDVISNLPFAVIGIWGLVFLLRSDSRRHSVTFIHDREIGLPQLW